MTVLKHKNNTDVAFYVLHDFSQPDSTDLVLRGVWINIASNPPFIMGSGSGVINEEIRIKLSDIANWVSFNSDLKARANVDFNIVKYK